MIKEYYEFNCKGPTGNEFNYYMDCDKEDDLFNPENIFIEFIEKNGLDIMFSFTKIVFIPEQWLEIVYLKDNINIYKI